MDIRLGSKKTETYQLNDMKRTQMLLDVTEKYKKLGEFKKTLSPLLRTMSKLRDWYVFLLFDIPEYYYNLFSKLCKDFLLTSSLWCMQKSLTFKKTVWMRWTNNVISVIATSLKIHHFGFPLLLSIGVQCNASKNKFGGKKTLAFSTVCERGEKSLPRRDLIPVYARPSPPLSQDRRNRGCNPPAPTNFGSNTSRQDLEPCLSKVLGLFLAPWI